MNAHLVTAPHRASRGLSSRRPRARTIALILGGMLALALASGLIYQTLASQRDIATYVADGRLVPVGNQQMYLHCTGAATPGAPTVILEAGAGGGSYLWGAIHEAFGGTARVCSYDRLGIGWSDPIASPVPSEQVARYLQTLLEQADVPPPYLMVGHSVGGIHVRSFQRLYPDLVAGMVLVDSSHEQQGAVTPPSVRALQNEGAAFLELCHYTAPFGLPRLIGLGHMTAGSLALPDAAREGMAATLHRNGACRSVLSERAAVEADTSQASGPTPLGDLPLVVLSAGKPLTESLPEGMTLDAAQRAEFEAMDAAFAGLQAQLVGLSTASQQIVVEGSGHYIHLEYPGVVIQAIQKVLEATTRS